MYHTHVYIYVIRVYTGHFETEEKGPSRTRLAADERLRKCFTESLGHGIAAFDPWHCDELTQGGTTQF